MGGPAINLARWPQAERRQAADDDRVRATRVAEQIVDIGQRLTAERARVRAGYL
jgi:hypothetical protein